MRYLLIAIILASPGCVSRRQYKHDIDGVRDSISQIRMSQAHQCEEYDLVQDSSWASRKEKSK